MIKPNVKDGSFVKHTIGETLEAGWLVKIERPGEFTMDELGYMKNDSYIGIVLDYQNKTSTGEEYWRILLPNGKMPIVTPDEVELVVG
jgi:hypothetical protein